MEKNINKKIETYNQEYKEYVKQSILNLNNSVLEELRLKNVKDDYIHINFMSVVQSISDYPPITLDKTDFQKRKRIKNAVSSDERCCAKRANNEQCTRRKKQDTEFCGTHHKGAPYGVVDVNNVVDETNQSLVDQASSSSRNEPKNKSVWVQDIKGIMYYIDEMKNVYATEDIMKNIVNPRIIANYSTSPHPNGTDVVYSMCMLHNA